MSYFVGICRERGKTVDEEEAFLYAICRILSSETEQKEFLDWYYSGNWVRSEEED